MLALISSLALAGCGEPLKAAELLEETRVLGARVEVEGDPERAAPGPGERATVRWFVASPADERPALGWAFSACAAAPVQNGLPLCAAAPFGRYTSTVADAADPSFVLELPAAGESASSEWVAITGVVCVEGTPLLDGPAGTFEQPACSRGSDRLLVNLYLLVRRGEVTNRNPSLASAEILLDGEPWLPADAAACADPGALTVPPGGRHEISVGVVEADREPLPAPAEAGPTRETLQLTSVSTDGALDRSLSVVEASSSNTKMETPWSAPADPGTAGVTVRFMLVLRDLRGGTDWTIRTLCVR
jgi:hypothetical protein